MNRTLLFLALVALSAPAFAQDGRDIDKVNGHITAEAGQAYGDLSTVNGGIDLQRGARAGDVETVNGGVDAGDEVATRDVSTVNGGIHFGRDARIGGDLETVNGGIFVDRGGRVEGGVGTVNGAIGLVDTDVAEGIATVNGDLTVGIGSHVRGGIRYEKPDHQWISFKQRNPRVVIAQDARVDGPLVFEHEVSLYVHDSATIGPVSGAEAVRYSGTRAPGGD